MLVTCSDSHRQALLPLSWLPLLLWSLSLSLFQSLMMHSCSLMNLIEAAVRQADLFHMVCAPSAVACVNMGRRSYTLGMVEAGMGDRTGWMMEGLVLAYNSHHSSSITDLAWMDRKMGYHDPDPDPGPGLRVRMWRMTVKGWGWGWGSGLASTSQTRVDQWPRGVVSSCPFDVAAVSALHMAMMLVVLTVMERSMQCDGIHRLLMATVVNGRIEVEEWMDEEEKDEVGLDGRGQVLEMTFAVVVVVAVAVVASAVVAAAAAVLVAGASVEVDEMS